LLVAIVPIFAFGLLLALATVPYVSLGPVIPSHLQLLNSQARMSLP